jgi:HlyD family secretion protein
MKRAVIVVLIVGAIGAGAGAYYKLKGGAEVQVNTSPVTRGDIIDTVGATGTLQAVTTVQVGSQVSGNISWLGADFNSIVKKGQVIARLDPSLFEAQVEQAKANLLKSQADVEHNKVALVDAQQKYTRAKELNVKQLETQADLDAAKIAVDSAQAMLQSSQASVTQSQASLNQNQVNLDHCVITAPIDGIVTQRSVDVGQTVAASMQAPTLFILAADLTKMQVNANIDEADVGRIRPNQTVIFRVDAYPTEDFEGTVEQIRLQPVVVQNVTTYGTIINVPNPDLKLKPGMTANLKVQIAKRSDVLRVPNAALRFRPSTDVFAALNQAVPPEAQFGPGGRGGRGGRNATAAGATSGPAGSTASTPSGPSGSSASSGPAPKTSGSAQQGVNPNATSGNGTGGGQGSAGRGGDNSDRQARMMERFKTMSADEQKQFLARMKDRRQDTSAFEKVAAPAPKTAAKGKPNNALQPKYGAVQSGETIDALFAPLPTIETQGRAWVYMDKQLKAVRLRLGITDGTNTELLSGELQPNVEVVTSVITSGATTRPAPGGGTGGNPLMPQRGGPGRGR